MCPIGEQKRRVVLLAAPDSQILDIAGPAEIFTRTARLLSGQKSRFQYQVELASIKEHLVPTSCGLSLPAHTNFARLRGPIDTLLVVGGSGVPALANLPEVLT
jgi:transcriptional regulator GlxA family with amidase domain